MKNNILSTNQVEILALAAVGYEQAKISKLLSISPHTVRAEIDIIFSRIGAPNDFQAAPWAAKNL